MKPKITNVRALRVSAHVTAEIAHEGGQSSVALQDGETLTGGLFRACDDEMARARACLARAALYRAAAWWEIMRENPRAVAPEVSEADTARAASGAVEMRSALRFVAAALKQPCQVTDVRGETDVRRLRALVEVLRGDARVCVETAERTIAQVEGAR